MLQASTKSNQLCHSTTCALYPLTSALTAYDRSLPQCYGCIAKASSELANDQGDLTLAMFVVNAPYNN